MWIQPDLSIKWNFFRQKRSKYEINLDDTGSSVSFRNRKQFKFIPAMSPNCNPEHYITFPNIMGIVRGGRREEEDPTNPFLSGRSRNDGRTIKFHSRSMASCA